MKALGFFFWIPVVNKQMRGCVQMFVIYHKMK